MRSDTTVIVLDQHALVRTGLRAFFNTLYGIRITEDFRSAGALLEHLQDHHADVVVLDCFQGEHAAKAQALLQAIQHRSHCRLVVFSSDLTSSARAMCIAAGADAYVGKCEVLDTLASTVRSVVEMSRPRIPGAGIDFLASALHELTPREKEVMQLVADGLCTTQIAKALDRATSTVSAQKWSGLRKLQVSSENEFLKLLPPDFRWPLH